MGSRIAFVVVGLVAASAIVGAVLFLNRGSHVVLRGEILKVRTHEISRERRLVQGPDGKPREFMEVASVAVADFRFANPSDYPFVVKDVEVTAVLKDGSTAPGRVIAEVDATRMMEGIRQLGPKYNDSLIVRTRIPPRRTEDRMIAARFDLPEAELASRRTLVIRVAEVDGALSRIEERPR